MLSRFDRRVLAAAVLISLGLARPALAEPDEDEPGPGTLARARKLIDVAGSADEKDARILSREVAKLPAKLLEGLEREDIHFVVCRRSVADGVPLWKNEQVRGWPAGWTYDRVPGRGDPKLRMVVVATVGHGTPQGAHIPQAYEGHEDSNHGSASLVFHEMAHALDGTLDRLGSRRASFLAARDADLPGLSDYEAQKGRGGILETYAESFARYYAGDPFDAQDHPNLHAFWATDPLELGPVRLPRPDLEAERLLRAYRALLKAYAALRHTWTDLEGLRDRARPPREDEPKHWL